MRLPRRFAPRNDKKDSVSTLGRSICLPNILSQNNLCPESLMGCERCRLERFTIEMAFLCASENEEGKEQKRSHSGLRRVFVTQAADAATSRWATDQP